MHKTSQNIRIKSSCGGGKRPPLSVPKHHLRLSQNWLMTSGAVKLFFPNSSLTFLWWGHYNCGASVLHCLKFQAWVEMKYFLNLNIFSGASKIFSRDWRTIGNRIYRQPPALTHWASSFGCSGSRTGHVLFLEPASANLSSLSQVQNIWISYLK